MRKYIVILLLLLPVQLQAQKTDSLLTELPNTEGQEQIGVLNELLEILSCTDSARFLHYQAQIRQLFTERKSQEGKSKYFQSTAYHYYCTERVGLASSYFDSAYLVAYQQADYEQAGKMKSNFAALNKVQGKPDKAKKAFQAAYLLGIQAKDTAVMCSALQGIGNIYSDKGVADSAVHFYIRAEKLLSQTNNIKQQITLRHNIATVSYLHSPEKLNLKYIEENLKMAQDADYLEGQVDALTFLGNVLSDSKNEHTNFNQAIEYLRKALSLNKQLKHSRMDIQIYRDLSCSYLHLEHYETAIELGTKGVELCEKTGQAFYLPELQFSIAKAYLALNNHSKAIFYGETAKNFTENIERDDLVYLLDELLAEAYFRSGKLKKAYLLQKEFILKKDEVLGLEKQKNIAKLQAKYESEKKEAEIQNLTQADAIKELKLKQQNQWLIVGGISTLLLFALGLAAYFRARQKQTETKIAKAEVEQRFLRSQLNPHFVFNALDSIQNYMLDNDAPKAGLYMSKFAKLMRQVLENSRENFIPLSEEIKMLENYMGLQQLQSEEEFTYSIQVDEQIESEDFAIPPMFVQPFVENAIEHGVIAGKGNISINFQLEGELVNIIVTDNGVGLSESKKVQKQQAKQHNSLATSIIKERIESYNEKLKTNIQLLVSEIIEGNKSVLGTKVELKVPFQRG